MGFDSLPPHENSRRVPAIEPIVQLPVLQNDRHGAGPQKPLIHLDGISTVGPIAATVHLHSQNFSKEIN